MGSAVLCTASNHRDETAEGDTQLDPVTPLWWLLASSGPPLQDAQVRCHQHLRGHDMLTPEATEAVH